MQGARPSPTGRGCREAAGEGKKPAGRLPHPALRATFSRREKVDDEVVFQSE